jgi:hypothetical protein
MAPVRVGPTGILYMTRGTWSAVVSTAAPSSLTACVAAVMRSIGGSRDREHALRRAPILLALGASTQVVSAECSADIERFGHRRGLHEALLAVHPVQRHQPAIRAVIDWLTEGLGKFIVSGWIYSTVALLHLTEVAGDRENVADFAGARVR